MKKQTPCYFLLLFLLPSSLLGLSFIVPETFNSRRKCHDSDPYPHRYGCCRVDGGYCPASQRSAPCARLCEEIMCDLPVLHPEHIEERESVWFPFLFWRLWQGNGLPSATKYSGPLCTRHNGPLVYFNKENGAANAARRCPLSFQLFLQQLVNQGGVGLALGFAHNLTHKKGKKLGFASFVFLRFRWVFRYSFSHGFFQLPTV